MVSHLKRLAAECLFRSGALSLHRTLFEKHRSIVLMYHRVNDEGDPFFPSLPVQAFAEQLDYLQASYEIATLESAVEWVLSGGKGAPRVALTLDDGYLDTYDYVLPELEKRRIPATLFLTTSPLETSQPLWVDRLRNTVRNATRQRIDLPRLGIRRDDLGSLPDRLATVRSLLEALKRQGPLAIEATLSALEEQLEPEGPDRRALTWEEIRRMAEGPIQIGAHTHRHYPLSQLEDDQVVYEIETSVRLIEERLRTKVTTFAYPNGQPGDYDHRSIAVLRQLGIRYAVTARTDFVRSDLKPYELTRLYTTEAHLPSFATRIAGLGGERPAAAELREAPAQR